MQNPMRPQNRNQYDLVTRIVSGILAGIFTFFVFPFAFLSVHGVSAFASDHYAWLPEWFIWGIWGLILAVGLFAAAMLLFILAINMGLKAMGRR